MTDQDFKRILAAVDGYWPHSPLKENARKAWRHLLGSAPVDQTLEALSGYAAEGHPFPPTAGQLAARSKPAVISKAETERERCHRQRINATQKVRDGLMTKRDFDWYEDRYWSKHDPQIKAA